MDQKWISVQRSSTVLPIVYQRSDCPSKEISHEWTTTTLFILSTRPWWPRRFPSSSARDTAHSAHVGGLFLSKAFYNRLVLVELWNKCRLNRLWAQITQDASCDEIFTATYYFCYKPRYLTRSDNIRRHLTIYLEITSRPLRRGTKFSFWCSGAYE